MHSFIRLDDLLKRRLNWGTRQVMVRLLADRLPSYSVCEYPKCGGTWLGQMLSASLHVGFPRNQIPALFSPSIIHCHFLLPYGMRNVVVIWRDPRDVMVSFYHYVYFVNETKNDQLVARYRRELPFDDFTAVTQNLPIFINRVYEQPIYPRFSYSAFIDKWLNREGVVFTSYEALLRNTPAELSRVVFDLVQRKLPEEEASKIADFYSFKKQSDAAPRANKAGRFLRAGVAGDWMNWFSQEAREVMHKKAQRDLERLGYERDSAWASGGG